MNVQSIGESAGVVWRLLNGTHRKWEYNEIKEATNLSNRELNAAIGWLAREDKIQFEAHGEGDDSLIYIALNYYIG